MRIGNGAADQLQLDVWGEVLDCLALTRTSLLKHPDDSWDVQVALMEHLETVWDQPDNGLWEMRGPRRHFTHSKVMAWVAADRMVKGVRDVRAARPGGPLGGAPGHHPRRRDGQRVRRRTQHLRRSPTAGRSWTPACC